MADGNGKISFWGEGEQPMSSQESAKVQSALAAGESIAAWARGRTDGKRALWVATERRLLRVGLTFFGRRAEHALDSLRAIEEQEGAHGMTLRVTTATEGLHLIAISPGMSRRFVAHLGERTGIAPQFIPSKKAKGSFASGVVSRPMDVAAELERRAAAAAAPAPAPLEAPATPAPAAGPDLVSSLREAAELHRSGVLTDAEFAALKAKLLQPAS